MLENGGRLVTLVDIMFSFVSVSICPSMFDSAITFLVLYFISLFFLREKDYYCYTTAAHVRIDAVQYTIDKFLYWRLIDKNY